MIVSARKHIKEVVNEIINLQKLYCWPFVELTKIGGIDSKKTICLFLRGPNNGMTTV